MIRSKTKGPGLLGGAIVVAGLALALLQLSPSEADRMSVIVQGTDLEHAASAVRATGATITHELGIINAVAGELTPAQIEAVRKMDGVRRVMPNSSVSTSAKPTGQSSTFADKFDRVRYNNNDGTNAWIAPWTETSDDGSPSAGNVRIQGDRLRLDNLDGGSLESISRAADLSAASSATLSFVLWGFGEGGLDIVAVEVSVDGGSSFALLDSIEIVGYVNEWERTYSLEQFVPLGRNLIVRFRIVQGLAATSQYVSFDDVVIQITGTDSGATGSHVVDSHFPELIDADRVHAENNQGWDVTIAVLDTGLWKHDGLYADSTGAIRLDAVYDARSDRMLKVRTTTDGNGHGSHISSVAASSLVTNEGLYNGIAPGAGIVSIIAFDTEGSGTYADVIRGIDWAVQNMGWIRILNLSIGAPVKTHYWDDPLNQAVMRAWQVGLVVVTSAGNTGSAPQTITVPGNVPYVITVGAMTDAETPSDPSDDRLAAFSAAGPTYDGFVKPEILAPGGHMLGLMPSSSTLAQTYPEFHDGGKYFTMSGTSQAAGVVSGIVALMLTADQTLSPDDVKCRLLDSARPATNPDTTLAYSIFQQGAGLVNAYDAVHSTASGCANRGLNIDYDLGGVQHYGGRANQDATGTYYLMKLDGDGYTWDGTFDGTTGYPFTDGYMFTDGYIFTDGYLFTDGTIGTDGYVWTDGYTFTDGYTWTDGYMFTDGYPFTDAYPFTDSLTEAMSVNVWVPQE